LDGGREGIEGRSESMAWSAAWAESDIEKRDENREMRIER
jgi:hypothetical protein